ncbi:MAG: ATP-binding cassette domain-containing protein [Gemmatimonadota bacterium]|nr:ATP-binding cassette domain-containing protein [Gemmatimonadota bacterium]
MYPAPPIKKRRGPVGLPGGPAPQTIPAAGPNGIIALEGLDLEIREGELFGLLGPNGAGKTTTIGILTTRVKPTSGQALVSGLDVVREEVGVKQRIGVVPQRPNADRALNVRENLVFHAAYFGIPRARSATRAGELLEKLGIADKAEAKVDELSGGQQQRLMIARALIHEPRVLFLDEPTVGLDPQARLGLWEILRELHSQGRTIVMTTHYMAEADELCDRLAIIDRGKLLALDTPNALKSQAPGGTLVELDLDGEAQSSVDDAGKAAGVLRVEANGNTLRVYAERGGEVIPPIIRLVEQRGRTVRDIHLSPPSLETLFISLTGRKLD